MTVGDVYTQKDYKTRVLEALVLQIEQGMAPPEVIKMFMDLEDAPEKNRLDKLEATLKDLEKQVINIQSALNLRNAHAALTAKSRSERSPDESPVKLAAR